METIYHEIQALSREGGWVFWCLVALGFGIAYSLLSIWLQMEFRGAPLFSGSEWRRLITQSGKKTELFAVFRDQVGSGDIPGKMRELDECLFAAAGRRIPFAFVLIGAAPLVGLLGTVSGMFNTFDGLAGVAGAKPVDVISGGVSEALITTQTGLIISVPTFIICSLLKGKFEQLRHNFHLLEARLTGECGEPINN